MGKTSASARGGKLPSANNQGFSGGGSLPHASGKGPYGPGVQPGWRPGGKGGSSMKKYKGGK